MTESLISNKIKTQANLNLTYALMQFGVCTVQQVSVGGLFDGSSWC